MTTQRRADAQLRPEDLAELQRLDPDYWEIHVMREPFPTMGQHRLMVRVRCCLWNGNLDYINLVCEDIERRLWRGTLHFFDRGGRYRGGRGVGPLQATANVLRHAEDGLLRYSLAARDAVCLVPTPEPAAAP